MVRYNKGNLVKKIFLSLLLIAIVTTFFTLSHFKIRESSYYEHNLSPEEVIEKYYEAYNSHNKTEMKTTLTGYLKDGSFEFEKSIKIEVCSIEEDLKEKSDYMTYGSCPISNGDNVKAFKVVGKKINKINNTEVDNVCRVFCLIKTDDDSDWLISNIGD